MGSSLYDISEQMETADIAHGMQLLAGPPEDAHPRNVGILMFSEKIDRYFPHARIEEYDLRCDRYRNRRIGDFLKELGLCEGRNTGFPKALAALDANGSPRPTFWMDEARGYLTVRLQVHPAFLPASHSPSKRDLEYRARIEEALAAGPLSLTELSRAMGYKSIP